VSGGVPMSPHYLRAQEGRGTKAVRVTAHMLPLLPAAAVAPPSIITTATTNTPISAGVDGRRRRGMSVADICKNPSTAHVAAAAASAGDGRVAASAAGLALVTAITTDTTTNFSPSTPSTPLFYPLAPLLF
jgi:hypothetical protein